VSAGREPAILVCEYFSPTVGGAPRWLGAYVSASRRYEWTVLTRPVAGAPAEAPFPGPSGPHRVVRLPWWREVTRPWGGIATFFLLAKLRGEIRRRLAATGSKRIDAMPLHFGGVAALGPARRAGAKVVLHLFGEEMAMLRRRGVVRQLLLGQALREADRAYAISPATRDLAIQLGADPARVELAIGVDCEPYRALPSVAEAKRRWGVEGRPVLLTVARLSHRKGHATVIQALPEIHPQETIYLVAGEGPERMRLSHLARSLGVEDRVRFLGGVADPDLPSLYRAADLFVHPHREVKETGEIEGFGLVFLEAALAEVPSIAGRSGATATTGPETAIEDGETGRLVAPEAPEALARVITVLLADEAGRRAMGRAGRARTLARFDIEKVVERMEK